MNEQPQTRAERERLRNRKVRISFVAVVAISFVVLLAFGFAIHDARDASAKAKRAARDAKAAAHDAKANSVTTANLVKENAKRISEIQASRVASCRRTYTVIEGLFRPFVPTTGQTAKEKADAKKFFGLIETQRARCAQQVKPRKP